MHVCLKILLVGIGFTIDFRHIFLSRAMFQFTLLNIILIPIKKHFIIRRCIYIYDSYNWFLKSNYAYFFYYNGQTKNSYLLFVYCMYKQNLCIDDFFLISRFIFNHLFLIGCVFINFTCSFNSIRLIKLYKNKNKNK